MQLPVYIVLTLAVFALLGFVYNDIKQYPQFKSLTTTEPRQQQFRKWLGQSFAVFGLGGVAGLWAIGHIDALVEMPEMIQLGNTADSTEEAGALRRFLGGFSSIFPYLLFAGMLLGPLVQAVLQRAAIKAERTEQTPYLGDIEPLLPRNNKERILSFWIAVNAGVSEEIFFRVLLFICLTSVTGSVWFGIVGATVLFGATHYYQGWVGIIATTIFGAICMFLYLQTQQIWVPIALHVLLDINALLVVPWITQRNLVDT